MRLPAAQDETVGFLHYGLGALVPTAHFDVFAGAGVYRSRISGVARPSASGTRTQSPIESFVQRDMEFSVGLRLRPF